MSSKADMLNRRSVPGHRHSPTGGESRPWSLRRSIDSSEKIDSGGVTHLGRLTAGML